MTFETRSTSSYRWPIPIYPSDRGARYGAGKRTRPTVYEIIFLRAGGKWVLREACRGAGARRGRRKGTIDVFLGVTRRNIGTVLQFTSPRGGVGGAFTVFAVARRVRFNEKCTVNIPERDRTRRKTVDVASTVAEFTIDQSPALNHERQLNSVRREERERGRGSCGSVATNEYVIAAARRILRFSYSRASLWRHTACGELREQRYAVHVRMGVSNA